MRQLKRPSSELTIGLGLWVLLVSAPAVVSGPAAAEALEDALAGAATSGAERRVCLSGPEASGPASRVKCEVELAPKLLQLSVLYGVDGPAGSTDSSWQDFQDHRFAGSAYGLLEPPGRPLAWEKDVEARMRLAGRSRGLRYGAEYRFSQSTPEDRWKGRPPSVRSGGRFESSWRLGFVEPKLELSRFQKQRLEHDADEETLSKARFAFDIRIPDLPLLTLSVGRETKKVESAASRSREVDAKEVLTDVASATLWYGRSRWEAYVTSSYFQIEQNLDDGSDAVLHDHIFSFTYRPTDALSLVPLLEYTKTAYPLAEYDTTSSLASLGVYHSSFGGSLNTFLYASYLADRDSLGYVDTRSVDLSAGIQQDISRFLGLSYGTQTLGLELNVGRYTDRIYREASTTSYGAFLRIRIQP